MLCIRVGCLFKKITPQYFAAPVRQKTVIRRGVRSLFGKYLVYTNTFSSSLLMAFGDLIQQEIEFQQKIIPHRYEWDRLGRMSIVGLILGLPQHWFYSLMDKRLPGQTLSTVAKKLLLDQSIASPFGILVFFFGMGLLEGKSYQACVTEIKEKFLTVLVVDWMVWPPVQFMNFYFLHDRYRVICVNSATMLYNIFLSYIKHVDYKHENGEK